MCEQQVCAVPLVVYKSLAPCYGAVSKLFALHCCCLPCSLLFAVRCRPSVPANTPVVFDVQLLYIPGGCWPLLPSLMLHLYAQRVTSPVGRVNGQTYTAWRLACSAASCVVQRTHVCAAHCLGQRCARLWLRTRAPAQLCTQHNWPELQLFPGYLLCALYADV